jgi:hypothetical protein
MKKIFFGAVLLVVSAHLFAQTEAEMKAWQNYMTPSESHELIKKYDGEWLEDITMWNSPDAAPIKSEAKATVSMIMGGRYQQSIITGNMMGMSFEGMSILGYDNAKKVFISTWIDNFGTGVMTLTGKWEQPEKVMTFSGMSVDPMTGKEQKIKQVIRFVDINTQKMEMYMIVNEKEIKTMELVSKRFNK